MKRRKQWLGLLVAVACLSGCETLRSQGLRGGKKADSARQEIYDDYLGTLDEEPRSIDPWGDPKASSPPKNRRLGGLSEEARSIERDMFKMY